MKNVKSTCSLKVWEAPSRAVEDIELLYRLRSPLTLASAAVVDIFDLRLITEQNSLTSCCMSLFRKQH